MASLHQLEFGASPPPSLLPACRGGHAVPAETYEAWLSLYVGVGILAAISAVMALAKTACDLRTSAVPVELTTWGGRILLLPRLFLRWQLNSLQGTPTILAIAVFYAHH